MMNFFLSSRVPSTQKRKQTVSNEEKVINIRKKLTGARQTHHEPLLSTLGATAYTVVSNE